MIAVPSNDDTGGKVDIQRIVVDIIGRESKTVYCRKRGEPIVAIEIEQRGVASDGHIVVADSGKSIIALGVAVNGYHTVLCYGSAGDEESSDSEYYFFHGRVT